MTDIRLEPFCFCFLFFPQNARQLKAVISPSMVNHMQSQAPHQYALCVTSPSLLLFFVSFCFFEAGLTYPA